MSTRIQPGTKFGRWTAIRRGPLKQDGRRMRPSAVVRCVCGRESTVLEHRLKSGRSSGCRSTRCQLTHAAVTAMATEVRAELGERLTSYVQGAGDE